VEAVTALEMREADATQTLTIPPDYPLSLVRGFVRGIDGHLRDTVRESLALLVTELVSNAIRHGLAPAELEVTWLAGTARLSVRSGGPPFRWRGGPSPWEDGGRGLMLVDAIADRWGTRRSAGRNEVWAELDY
jgi:two-component sensor histidine kinase